MGISLDYPVTKSFPSRILAPIVFTGAAISIIILTILNTALTAYQVQVTPSADFNISDTHWYTSFLPAALKKGGNNCDPVILGTGSSITTNQSIYLWDLFQVKKGNAGRTSFLYTGRGLDSCDISSLAIVGDLSAHSADIQLFAECTPSDKVDYVLTTTFNIAELAPSNIPTILGGTIDGNPQLGYAGQVCSILINLAGADLLKELLDFNAVNPESRLSRVTANANFVSCPSANSTGSRCQTEVPEYYFAYAGAALDNGNFTSGYAGDAQNPIDRIITPFIAALTSNLIQISAACARIDFGQNNTNNLLVNPSNAIPSGTILAKIPAGNGVPEFQTSVGENLADTDGYLFDNGTAVLPVHVRGPSVFEVAFSCRVKTLKSPGEAFIAVLVATTSMFMSGWGIFMFIAIMILKSRRPDSNVCVGCIDPEAQRPAPYTRQSGLSDSSKHPHSLMAMPSPDPMPVPYLAGQQYQTKMY